MAKDTTKYPSKMRMAWESVKDSAAGLPRRIIGVPKAALTVPVQSTIDTIEDRKRRMREAEEEDVPGMKRGGKIKPRGVGCAARGHGRGKMM